MNSNTPVVSVVMPVYNSESFLKEAIESILNQTYQNFEFIIAYDESTDKSFHIIKSYKKKDPRIILSTGKKRGLVKSLNDAFEISNGEYIVRMDADDISPLSRLESQLDFTKKNNLDICGGHCLLIDDKARINGLNIVPMSHDMCTLSMLFKVPFFHPSVMIRKSFLNDNLLKYGQSKYQMAEDLDFWVRMHKCGAIFGNVNSVILEYRVLKNSLSRVNNSLVLQNAKSIFKQFRKDNYHIVSRIVRDASPQMLNTEEKSLLVRYIFNDMKRLKFSNFQIMRQIDKKIILISIFLEIKRQLNSLSVNK
jgi:glycosyltransferase involved in cell wall biosynthesis